MTARKTRADGLEALSGVFLQGKRQAPEGQKETGFSAISFSTAVIGRDPGRSHENMTSALLRFLLFHFGFIL